MTPTRPGQGGTAAKCGIEKSGGALDGFLARPSDHHILVGTAWQVRFARLDELDHNDSRALWMVVWPKQPQQMQ